MSECQVCGKNGQFGHNVSHSKRRTNTRWLPNVHQARLQIDGRTQRVRLCTRCLRTHHRAMSAGTT
ncbi:MAG: 50S ribosomal protein L28 [Dehalococcoidia bacterium]|nr:50S ribosomal protein L28 [Dehalococcoidia bacterium]